MTVQTHKRYIAQSRARCQTNHYSKSKQWTPSRSQDPIKGFPHHQKGVCNFPNPAKTTKKEHVGKHASKSQTFDWKFHFKARRRPWDWCRGPARKKLIKSGFWCPWAPFTILQHTLSTTIHAHAASHAHGIATLLHHRNLLKEHFFLRLPGLP